MINEEKDNVRIYVVNSNTGRIVRSETILTNESLITVANRYTTKDSIIITSISNAFYCYYIKRKAYLCDVTNYNVVINFFSDVLDGLYDNARDSFHIEYGRVATMCQYVNNVDSHKYVVLLNCIDDIWETRYYSRFLRRGKND